MLKQLGFCLAVSLAAAVPTTSAFASFQISSMPTEQVTCSAGTCTTSAKSAVLNVADLAGMLASGDVRIVSGSVAKDIEIDAALSWTSAQRLTFDSYRSIAFNAPVVVTGTGALTITTDDGGKNGDFRFFKKGRVVFWDLTSSLIINGQTYRLEDKLNHLARAIRGNSSANYALAQSSSEKGRVYSAAPIPDFSGNFEGLGNTISHLTIAGSDGAQQIGMFGELVDFAVVRDFGLTSVDIKGGSGSNVGALTGVTLSSAVANVYATGQISGGAQAYVGGMLGQSILSLTSNSHADVSVLGSDGATAVGGLVGYLTGLRTNWSTSASYATGSVTGGDGVQVGGLVGCNFGGIVVNSYAKGPVSGGNSAFVGGLIGANSDDQDEGTAPQLLHSYSTGAVSGGSGALVGGLIGQDAADAQIRSSYWDLDTSGISDPHQGAGNISDAHGIIGLTTEQLTAALPAGFDPSIWNQKAKLNSGYPYLIDNQPSN